jgi:hypothetical protein
VIKSTAVSTASTKQPNNKKTKNFYKKSQQQTHRLPIERIRCRRLEARTGTAFTADSTNTRLPSTDKSEGNTLHLHRNHLAATKNHKNNNSLLVEKIQFRPDVWGAIFPRFTV